MTWQCAAWHIVGGRPTPGCQKRPRQLRPPVFWAHVSEAVEARPMSITIDSRGLTFVHSSGLMALARARDAATEAGATFRVSEPSPHFAASLRCAGSRTYCR